MLENFLPLDFTIIAFATFRISRMFVYENGPFYVFSRARSVKFIDILLRCVHCFGVWIAALVVVLYSLNIFVVNMVFVIFAIAGVQSFLELAIEGLTE